MAMPYSSPICLTAFTIIESRLTDDENLAAEVFPDHDLENFADLDPVDTHAEHDQVRLLGVQHSGQIAGLTAFAGDETEILERVGKEHSKVFFAVDDAGARRQLPMPEMGRRAHPREVDLTHLALPHRYPGR